MSKRAPRALRQAGFTLLEVLISMVILTFISLAIYEATTQTFRLRDTLSGEGEFYNGVRMSINIMERDLSAVYSPLSFREIGKKPDPQPSGSPAPEVEADPKTQAFLGGGKGATSEFWLGATDITGVRASRFVGEEAKLRFISTSHLRVYKGKPESDLAKITYELEASKLEEEAGTYILMRTESANVFQDDEAKDQYKRRYPLLRGIKSFKLAYFRRKSPKEWERLSGWDTDKADLKDKYPDKIELQLEVTGGPRLNYDGFYVFRPEMPYRGVANTY